MSDQQLLERVTLDPRVMVGKPVIRGTRLTVEYILNLLAHGATLEEILEEYEGLTREDIQACLLFATRANEPLWRIPQLALETGIEDLASHADHYLYGHPKHEDAGS